ncbi:MAG: HEAT repeat domain-containing protein, partial [Planctomycetota bacterium]
MPRRRDQNRQHERIQQYLRIRDRLDQRHTIVIHDLPEWLHPHATPAGAEMETPWDCASLVGSLPGHAARCIALITLGELMRHTFADLFMASDADDADTLARMDQLFGETAWRVVHGEMEWREVCAVHRWFADRMRDDQLPLTWKPHHNTTYERVRDRKAVLRLANMTAQMLATGECSTLPSVFVDCWHAVGVHRNLPQAWWRRFTSRLAVRDALGVSLGNLTPVLLRGLADTNDNVALAAATVLQVEREPAAGPALLQLIPRSGNLAYAAINALATAGASALDDWTPVLEVAASPGQYPSIRTSAMNALGIARFAPAIPVLEEIVARPASHNVPFRRSALAAMVAINADACRNTLRKAASDADAQLAVDAAAALTRLGDADGALGVHRLLDRRNMPAGLFDTLRTCAGVSHVPRLVALLSIHGVHLLETLAALPRTPVLVAAIERMIAAGP